MTSHKRIHYQNISLKKYRMYWNRKRRRLQLAMQLSRKRQFAATATVLVMAGMLSLAGSASAQAGDSDKIEGARKTLEKWVETRRIISKEKNNWEIAQSMLNERIGLVQREIENLQEKIKDAEKSISEADKKRVKLVEENDKLKRTATMLTREVTRMENRLRDLLKRLPPPIAERVQPLSQRLPDQEKVAETKISLSERFQNVIGIINEINKFNGEITVTSEVRELADGKSAEVTAIYLGIAQGYYTGANGTIGGLGYPTADGWEWTPADDIAGRILTAVNILKNEEVAAFVRLPVEIQ